MRRVLALVAPLGLAFIPLGMALGFLVVHSGLAWWWAPVFAGVIYAGSLEFLMVGLVAGGAAVATVAVTTLVVNARHVFYALSFPLHRVHGVAAKLYSTYTLSDEAYAVAVSPQAHGWTTRPILFMQVLFHLLWVGGATLGGLLGEVLPIDRLVGLDFALTALFIVLGIEAYRQRPDPVTAVLALLCAAGAWLVVPGQMLVCAFAAFTALLLLRRRTRHA
ncbi:branched-chain amino acid ABC transporter permease [Mycolicibacterium sp. 018/SC-01/001]|uniref:AzlC family ABC transporter permease n=1 Tax=Mycolicibacterium sp. 018/SC-01/001 TaxID=2592069 RepID=UPI00117E1C38|nr:AzlC family ABC transporter permease [Mycolicibacterium sp. 018/SC-01/001]TRW88296.1 branched-chain amino acid ABC transporter permease [Mycolicibacterium sp. 018/SC-01/001]